MAKQFLTDINLNKNELQNAVLQPLGYNPTNPATGQLYYNSLNKKPWIYNGENWDALGILLNLVAKKVNYSEMSLDMVSEVDESITSSVVVRGEHGIFMYYDEELDKIVITTSEYSIKGEENDAKTGYQITLNQADVSANDPKDPMKDIVTRAARFTIPLADAEKMGLLSPALFSKLNGLTIDSAMSDSSTNPVQNKIIKNYIDTAIGNLPKEQFLDLTKTTYVDSFTWSSTTYPGSTNPNLNGKPVMVLALKDNDGNVQYGFVSLNDLVDVYTGETPISVSGGKITHANSGATAGSYGDSGAQTPGFGGKFKALYATVDAKGHITGLSAHDVTIPNATATTSANGLMSSTDKSKLNNVTTNTYIKTGSIAAGSKSATITLNATADKVISVNAYVSGEHVECDWSVSGSTITVSIAQTLSSAVTIEAFAMKTL